MNRFIPIFFGLCCVPWVTAQIETYPHLTPRGALFDYQFNIYNHSKNPQTLHLDTRTNSFALDLEPESLITLSREHPALEGAMQLSFFQENPTIQIEFRYISPNLEEPIAISPITQSGYFHRYRTPGLAGHWLGLAILGSQGFDPEPVNMIRVRQVDKDGETLFEQSFEKKADEQKKLLLLSQLPLRDERDSYIEIHTNFSATIQSLYGSVPGEGSLTLEALKPLAVHGRTLRVSYVYDDVDPFIGDLQIDGYTVKFTTSERVFNPPHRTVRNVLMTVQERRALDTLLQKHDVFNMVLTRQVPEPLCDDPTVLDFSFQDGVRANSFRASRCGTVDVERTFPILEEILALVNDLQNHPF